MDKTPNGYILFEESRDKEQKRTATPPRTPQSLPAHWEDSIRQLLFEAPSSARNPRDPSTTAEQTSSGPLTQDLFNGVLQSAKRHPDSVLEAIWPALMPAIRNNVKMAFSQMMDSTNHILERALSLRVWRWRMQSWFTGKPLSEIILSHLMIYSVEEVLLIHRDSGLLLEHLTANEAKEGHPQLVSALLTAIQDFAKDSFEVNEKASLSHFRVGEMTVWVEANKDNLLALAVRGTPTYDLRESMVQSLRNLQRSHGNWLASYTGSELEKPDINLFLAPLLHAEYDNTKKRNSYLSLTALALLAALAFLLTSTFLKTHHSNGIIAKLESISELPGLLVTDIRKEAGTYVVRGSSDPLTAPLGEWLESNHLADEPIKMEFSHHLSLHPDITLRRARLHLQTPSTVSMDFRQGTLYVSGKAEEAWRLLVYQRWASIPGVAHLDTTELRNQ